MGETDRRVSWRWLAVCLGLLALSAIPGMHLHAADIFEAPTIEATALAPRLADPGSKIVLFDTRLADEIRVSRIAGSIAVDPRTEPAAILAQHGHAVAGHTVVFYCAIGLRSAGVANSLLDGLAAAGATDVLVLKDGIVGWANADLPLVSAQGPTTRVHPFDQSVVKFLRDPGRADFGTPP